MAKEREPKWKVWRRLVAAGKWEEFLEMKRFFKSHDGGRLKNDAAYYEALKHFPAEATGGVEDVDHVAADEDFDDLSGKE